MASHTKLLPAHLSEFEIGPDPQANMDTWRAIIAHTSPASDYPDSVLPEHIARYAVNDNADPDGRYESLIFTGLILAGFAIALTLLSAWPALGA